MGVQPWIWGTHLNNTRAMCHLPTQWCRLCFSWMIWCGHWDHGCCAKLAYYAMHLGRYLDWPLTFSAHDCTCTGSLLQWQPKLTCIKSDCKKAVRMYSHHVGFELPWSIASKIDEVSLHGVTEQCSKLCNVAMATVTSLPYTQSSNFFWQKMPCVAISYHSVHFITHQSFAFY